MAFILWQFWCYSFLGYLLEKAFALATHSPRQNRKGFLLLPLCPVYGFGVLAVLALPPDLRDNFWSLALWGGLAATAVEYVVHFLYDKFFHVQFWDYSSVVGNVRGRICPLFSLIWGGLLAIVFPITQMLFLPLFQIVPPVATYAALLLFTADAVISTRLLWCTRDPEQLTWKQRAA